MTTIGFTVDDLRNSITRDFDAWGIIELSGKDWKASDGWANRVTRRNWRECNMYVFFKLVKETDNAVILQSKDGGQHTFKKSKSKKNEYGDIYTRIINGKTQFAQRPDV